MIDPAFTRFSALLALQPRNEVCLLLSGYKDALRAGRIEAVPEAGWEFSITYLDAQGQEKTETHNEEFVLLTDKSARWISTQQLAARHLIMANTGTLTTTEERLNNNVDDLRALARMRRDALNASTVTEPEKSAPKSGRKKRKQIKKTTSSAKADNQK
ncbi:hypothetical protein EHF33_20135 (plasmid) [Deinococcus psychrotolerans]|uniref:Uncharacterized protein n=1 Tax=Deinococcus psychrotolerans TaxID=2489213 RepID=A0A3G8YUD1_9DEIO|nr:hypothetical protein [Deinococcus psychrotolerans]AZI45221.1 hypothetical protein EHF33_20135 [Deinococcus psychrotolerans]